MQGLQGLLTIELQSSPRLLTVRAAIKIACPSRENHEMLKIWGTMQMFFPEMAEYQSCWLKRLYLFPRLVGSKLDTPVTAVAIRTAIVPPATTEYSKFFRDGVTPASAMSGFAIAAATPVVTATGS